jgi:catechol 2,3-dioxygenase
VNRERSASVPFTVHRLNTADQSLPAMTLDYGIAPPGYRLPDATRLGPVRLQVADLGRSLDYYQRVLGLHLLDHNAGQAALAAEGEEEPLVALHERRGVRPVPRSGLLGLYHFAILLPDRHALGRFVAHLGNLGERAGSAEHGVSEALYLTDPDGLGIEVYADRPRSQWQHHNRQLYMTTDRLDIRGLLAAGGDRAWSGMPSGTTMGHVHLHVGDLDRAEAFYHRALGFDKVVWSYPGALFLSAGGYHHHLGSNTWSSGPPASAEDARLLEWTIVLPGAADVAAAAGSLRATGYEAGESGDEVVAADPWGTAVRLTNE